MKSHQAPSASESQNTEQDHRVVVPRAIHLQREPHQSSRTQTIATGTEVIMTRTNSVKNANSSDAIQPASRIQSETDGQYNFATGQTGASLEERAPQAKTIIPLRAAQKKPSADHAIVIENQSNLRLNTDVTEEPSVMPSPVQSRSRSNMPEDRTAQITPLTSQRMQNFRAKDKDESLKRISHLL